MKSERTWTTDKRRKVAQRYHWRRRLASIDLRQSSVFRRKAHLDQGVRLRSRALGGCEPHAAGLCHEAASDLHRQIDGRGWLISIEFAVFCLGVDYDPDLLVCVAFSGLVLQFGIFLAVRSRKRARAFWVGFVAFGAAAAPSCYYGLIVDSESSAAAVWDEYLGIVERLTGVDVFPNRFLWSSTRTGPYDILVRHAQMAIVLTLPQVVVALCGGSVVFFPAPIKKLYRWLVATLDNGRARTRNSPKVASR